MRKGHLWPSAPGGEALTADARAPGSARAAATEMHGGFQALRQHCTMNLWLPVKRGGHSRRKVLANKRRIETMWAECRARFGQGAKDGGPFLFGSFGNVDAMYASVVARFHNYGLPVGTELPAPIWTR